VLRRHLLGTAVGASLFLGLGVARADDEGSRLPIAYAARPLTLPKMVLSPDFELDFTAYNFGVTENLLGTSFSSSTTLTFLNMAVGARFGILDDLEARVVAVPLQLFENLSSSTTVPGEPSQSSSQAGKASYGNINTPGPTFGATYRLVKGDLELGAALDVSIVTYTDASGTLIVPSIPLRLHIGKSARLDTGVLIDIATAGSVSTGPSSGGSGGSISSSGSNVVAGMQIPLRVGFDITRQIHLGGETGFTIADFSNAGHTIEIPLGVFGGYTVVGGKEGPLIDIDPFFRWPLFFFPGAPDGLSAVEPGSFMVGVEAAGYLYL
jgi:hypothetical protein